MLPIPSTTFENLAFAVTLRGPELAEAILQGYKDVENRHRRLPLGWVALHTGKRKTEPHMRGTIHHLSPGMPAAQGCPQGAVAVSYTHLTLPTKRIV